MKRYAQKKAGVSFTPAAMPAPIPRSRLFSSRPRSHTIKSSRKMLICPSQSVVRIGSMNRKIVVANALTAYAFTSSR